MEDTEWINSYEQDSTTLYRLYQALSAISSQLNGTELFKFKRKTLVKLHNKFIHDLRNVELCSYGFYNRSVQYPVFQGYYTAVSVTAYNHLRIHVGVILTEPGADLIVMQDLFFCIIEDCNNLDAYIAASLMTTMPETHLLPHQFELVADYMASKFLRYRKHSASTIIRSDTEVLFLDSNGIVTAVELLGQYYNLEETE